MKTAILLTVLGLSGTFAHAEIFNCGFTEPFYTITYDTNSKVLNVKNDVAPEESEAINDVTYTNVNGAFEIKLSKNGSDLMIIKLTGNATDGMSNNIYPFEAHYVGMSGPNNGYGGCETQMWPAILGEN